MSNDNSDLQFAGIVKNLASEAVSEGKNISRHYQKAAHLFLQMSDLRSAALMIHAAVNSLPWASTARERVNATKCVRAVAREIFVKEGLKDIKTAWHVLMALNDAIESHKPKGKFDTELTADWDLYTRALCAMGRQGFVRDIARLAENSCRGSKFANLAKRQLAELRAA